MFCTKCGAQLQDGALFCSKCGAKNSSGMQTPVAETPVEVPKSEPVVTASEKKTVIQGIHDKGLFTALLIPFIIIFAAVFVLDVISAINHYGPGSFYIWRTYLFTICFCLPVVSMLCVERKKFNVIMLILSAVFVLYNFNRLILMNSRILSWFSEVFEDIVDFDFYYLKGDFEDLFGVFRSMRLGYNMFICCSQFIAFLLAFILKNCIKIRNIGLRIGSFAVSVFVYKLMTFVVQLVNYLINRSRYYYSVKSLLLQLSKNLISCWPVYLIALGALVGFLFLNNKTETIEV